MTTAAPSDHRPAQPRLIQVKRIHDLSPHLRCITFHGDTLHDYPAAGRHAAHIKLFLARPGQRAPTLPQWGERGPVWPEGKDKPLVRTYTVFAFRPDAAELDIVFALHDNDGPASHFARHAREGDCVGVSQPGGPHPMLPAAAAYYLAGDPSSLPAIAALLAALPDDAQGHAVIRVDAETDRLALKKPQGITLRWIIGDTGVTHEVIEHFQHLPHHPMAAEAFYWLAGEDGLVVPLRRHVRRERQAERNQLYAIPYWRDGLNEEDYHQKRHRVMDNPDD